MCKQKIKFSKEQTFPMVPFRSFTKNYMSPRIIRPETVRKSQMQECLQMSSIMIIREGTGVRDKSWPQATVGSASCHQNNVYVCFGPSVPWIFWYKNQVNLENYRAQCPQFCFVPLYILSIIEFLKELITASWSFLVDNLILNGKHARLTEAK